MRLVCSKARDALVTVTPTKIGIAISPILDDQLLKQFKLQKNPYDGGKQHDD